MRKILLFFLIISIQSFAANDSLPVTIAAKPSAVVPENKDTRIVIRCGATNFNGAPLLIIDGVPADASQLKQLNPNDIIRIDILKGSSAAAIYGQCAANGIVIITTKRRKHLVIQDADSKSFLEGATVKILPDKKNIEPIVLIADKNGEADLSSLKDKQEYTMEVSCIGYKTKTIRISKTENNRPVELEKDFKRMGEVIVVTYSSQCGHSCGCICYTTRQANYNDVQKSDAVNFAVYPNPSAISGTVTVNLSRPMEGKISIVNAAGQTVQALNIADNNTLISGIKLNVVTAGIYFIRLTDAKTKKTFSQKLIIQ